MIDIAGWLQCINFAGGLTQSDWFTLTAGTLGSGFTLAQYNQSGYLANVSLRQAQIYQKKNYNLSWVSVARDDVRGMMSISVNRINNYMLVAVFVFSVAANALFFVPSFDTSCPDFVLNSFWLCTGLSIAFLSLSIMFGIKGQSSAFVNTMRLLTWELRPENPSTMDFDYLKQAYKFEDEGMKEFLRVPGLMNAKFKLTTAHPEAANSNSVLPEGSKPSRKKKPDIYGTSLHEGSRLEGDETVSKTSTVEQLYPETNELLYLARFVNYMQLWLPYESNSKYCIGLGFIALSQGGAYFSLGVLSWGQHSGGFLMALEMIAIFVSITIMIYQSNYKAKNNYLGVGVITLFIAGPTFAAIGALINDPQWVRKVFAPLTCLAHASLYFGIFLYSYVQTKDPSYFTREYVVGPHGQRFTRNWRDGSLSSNKGSKDSSSIEFLDLATTPSKADRHTYFSPPSPSLKAKAKQRGRSYSQDNLELGGSYMQDGVELESEVCQQLQEDAKSHAVQARSANSIRAMLIVASILWLALFFLEISEAVSKSYVSSFLPSLDLQSVPVSWPKGTLGLLALSCGQSGELFVANRFQVFRVNPYVGSVVAQTCRGLNQMISDVSVACTPQDCLVEVLAVNTSTVIDCASGTTTPLLQAPASATRFTIGTVDLHPGQSQSTLLAIQAGSVIEYRMNLVGNAVSWSAINQRTDLDGTSLLNLDIQRQQLYLFGMKTLADGSVSNWLEVRGLLTFESRGVWALSAKDQPIVSGCADSNGEDVWILTGGRSPQLWKTTNPR